MTSRLSPGGLQGKLGILPDLTTFGKYIGGGMSFGAFGGRAELMSRFDPAPPGRVPACRHLQQQRPDHGGRRRRASPRFFTPAAADALTASGERLQARLNGSANATACRSRSPASARSSACTSSTSRSAARTTPRTRRRRRARCSTSRCWRAASTSRGAASSPCRCRSPKKTTTRSSSAVEDFLGACGPALNSF